MHRLVILFLLFLVGTWYACQVEVAGHAKSSEPKVNSWVRTVDGWQRKSDWTASPALYSPGLHPLLVALVQGLLSLLVLIAFPAGRWHRTGERPRN